MDAMKRGKGNLKPVRYFATVFNPKIHKRLAPKSHSPRKSKRPGGGRYNLNLKASHKSQQVARIVFREAG